VKPPLNAPGTSQSCGKIALLGDTLDSAGWGGVPVVPGCDHCKNPGVWPCGMLLLARTVGAGAYRVNADCVWRWLVRVTVEVHAGGWSSRHDRQADLGGGIHRAVEAPAFLSGFPVNAPTAIVMLATSAEKCRV
jgi:hypothetical protein